MNAQLTPIIECRQVWKYFGQTPVLEKLNLQVAEREFVTLVGASGCGKTTFLKMLLGIEQPTRGSFLFAGQPLPHEPGPERGIVFQRYSVFPHLNVLGNVMLGLELKQSRWLGRLWGAQRRTAVTEAQYWLDQVGLGAHAQKYPHELSGGMQQRLALAQCLIMQPRLLLLDEPFGALDPGTKKEMHQLVLSLWREQSLSILMITHDMSEAFELGSRLWVFDKVRHDAQAPDAYGASLTYDLPIDAQAKARQYIGDPVHE